MKLETSEGERAEFRKWFEDRSLSIIPHSLVPDSIWAYALRLLRDIDTLLAEVERLRAAVAPPLPAEVEEVRGKLEARVTIIEAFVREINASPGGEHEKMANELREAAALLSRWPGVWRPIETAPKMKTIMLFAVTDRSEDGAVKNWKMETGFWHSGFVDHHDMSPWQWCGRQLATYDVQPTHWSPLPEPPHE